MVDEVLVKDENGDSKCVPSASISFELNSTEDDDFNIFSPLFSDFNKTGALAPGDKRDRFLAIVGDPCRFKRYQASCLTNLLRNKPFLLPHGAWNM